MALGFNESGFGNTANRDNLYALYEQYKNIPGVIHPSLITQQYDQERKAAAQIPLKQDFINRLSWSSDGYYGNPEEDWAKYLEQNPDIGDIGYTEGSSMALVYKDLANKFLNQPALLATRNGQQADIMSNPDISSWVNQDYKAAQDRAQHTIDTNNSSWVNFRDGIESALVLAGNYFVPGSSMLTSNLASTGSQNWLNSDTGQAGQLFSGIAGGANTATNGSTVNTTLVGNNGYLGTTGNTLVDTAANNAAKGALTSGATGRDPLQGATSGLVGSAIGAAGNVAGGALNQMAGGGTFGSIVGQIGASATVSLLRGQGLSDGAIAGLFKGLTNPNTYSSPTPNTPSTSGNLVNLANSSTTSPSTNGAYNTGTLPMSGLIDFSLNYSGDPYSSSSSSGNTSTDNFLGNQIDLSNGNVSSANDPYGLQNIFSTPNYDPYNGLFDPYTGATTPVAPTGNSYWDNLLGGMASGGTSSGTDPYGNATQAAGTTGGITPTAGSTANKSNALSGILKQLGIGGGNTSNAGLLSGLLNAYNQNKNSSNYNDIMNKIINMSDPFASQRPQYQQQLSGLMANPNTITNNPAYKFRLDQGLDAVNRNSAASGMLNTGNRLQSLTDYGQKSASQEYNNQVGVLSGLAGANINPQNVAGTVSGLAKNVNDSNDSLTNNILQGVTSYRG